MLVGVLTPHGTGRPVLSQKRLRLLKKGESSLKVLFVSSYPCFSYK